MKWLLGGVARLSRCRRSVPSSSSRWPSCSRAINTTGKWLLVFYREDSWAIKLRVLLIMVVNSVLWSGEAISPQTMSLRNGSTNPQNGLPHTAHGSISSFVSYRDVLLSNPHLLRSAQNTFEKLIRSLSHDLAELPWRATSA